MEGDYADIVHLDVEQSTWYIISLLFTSGS